MYFLMNDEKQYNDVECMYGGGKVKRQDISFEGEEDFLFFFLHNLIIFLSVVELAFFNLTLDFVCIWLFDAAPATI